VKAVVLGGGFAGCAAFYALRSRGVDCTWSFGPGGASLMTSGAFDAAQDTSVAAREFTGAFGLHALESREALLVTRLGTVRTARGADRAVLDLNRVPPGSVGVLGLPRAGWDAAWVAQSLNALRRTRAQGLVFSPFSASGVMDRRDAALAAGDYAELLQERRELVWRQLRTVQSQLELRAWLLPPACLLDAQQVATWEAQLGVPVGETLSGVADLAGQRFERAREALASRHSVIGTHHNVTGLRVSSDGVSVTTNAGEVTADVAVIATGSWIGGGLRLSANNRAELSYAVEPPSAVHLTLEGRPFSSAAVFGVDASRDRFDSLASLGLRILGPAAERVEVAGEACPDRERTLGAAIELGLQAAERLLARAR
jgi:glycine/D-amino acid oxidase-like deaminating enzyme